MPRTTRARLVQPISDTITVMAKYILTTGQPVGSAALSPIHSGRGGIDMMISIRRWITSSTVPPKKPATPPIRMPRKKLIATPTRPTYSEICEPYRVRENTSRPRESVPNRWTGTPSTPVPNRCRSDSNSPNSL